LTSTFIHIKIFRLDEEEQSWGGRV